MPLNRNHVQSWTARSGANYREGADLNRSHQGIYVTSPGWPRTTTRLQHEPNSVNHHVDILSAKPHYCQNVRIYVFDKDNTPQRFPLLDLFAIILANRADSAEPWHVTRSQGQGLSVNELDALLDNAEYVSLDVSDMTAILPGIDEWFYNFVARTPDSAVVFGLIDSTYMFVEGPRELLDAVQLSFANTADA